MAYHHELGAPSPALLRLLGIVTLLVLAPLLALAWLRSFWPAGRPARVQDLSTLRPAAVVLHRPDDDAERRLAV